MTPETSRQEAQTTEEFVAETELPQEMRDRIALMKSKQDQIDAYGPEKWKDTFIRLSDLQELAGINLTGAALQNESWKKLPHSKFKAAQEAFSSELIIPVPTVSNGEIFYPRKRFNYSSVQGCLFDVDLVRDKLVTDMGLIDQKKLESAVDDFERASMKYSAIPALKKAIDGARQLAARNKRVLILQKSYPELNERYAGIPDVPDEVIGSILYTREMPSGVAYSRSQEKKEGIAPRRLAVSFFADVYRARRKTNKQSRNYARRETPSLANILNSALTLNERLDTEWTKDASEETRARLIAEAEELVASVEKSLKHARQRHRRAIYDALMTVGQKLRERKPSPGMTKIVQGIDAIELRQQDMSDKEPFNAQDGLQLDAIISKQQSLLLEVRGNVEKGAKIVDSPLQIYAQQVSPAIMEPTIKRAKRDLQLPGHASDLPIRPFSTYVDALNEGVAHVEASMRAGDREAAKQNVLHMHVIGKFQAAHACVEMLKSEIADPLTVSMARIRKLVGRIEHVFQGRELFPDIAPIHLQELYEPVEAALLRIHEIIDEAGPDIETDEETMQKFCRHLRDHLDTFDLERLTRDLMTKMREQAVA